MQRFETFKGTDFPADPKQGYWVDYRHAKDAPAEFEHYFCGPQEVSGAWCLCCQKPFVRYLALDTRDARLNLQDSPFPTLSLLDCPRCTVEAFSPADTDGFFYRVLDDGGIEPIGYVMEGRQANEDFPYKDYPLFFPGAVVTLHAISPVEQAVLTRINNRPEWTEAMKDMDAAEVDELLDESWWGQEPYESLWEIRHQVGGEPFLIQGLTLLKCPDCGTQMPFLASIANDCLDPRGTVGWEDVQRVFHYCRCCYVVGTYNRCD